MTSVQPFSGLNAAITDDGGHVALQFTLLDSTEVAVAYPANQGGNIAGLLLRLAQQCREDALAKQLPAHMVDPTPVSVDGVAVEPGDTPGTATLVLTFGLARLACAIDRAALESALRAAKN